MVLHNMITVFPLCANLSVTEELSLDHITLIQFCMFMAIEFKINQSGFCCSLNIAVDQINIFYRIDSFYYCVWLSTTILTCCMK